MNTKVQEIVKIGTKLNKQLETVDINTSIPYYNGQDYVWQDLDEKVKVCAVMVSTEDEVLPIEECDINQINNASSIFLQYEQDLDSNDDGIIFEASLDNEEELDFLLDMINTLSGTTA